MARYVCVQLSRCCHVPSPTGPPVWFSMHSWKRCLCIFNGISLVATTCIDTRNLESFDQVSQVLGTSVRASSTIVLVSYKIRLLFVYWILPFKSQISILKVGLCLLVRWPPDLIFSIKKCIWMPFHPCCQSEWYCIIVGRADRLCNRKAPRILDQFDIIEVQHIRDLVSCMHWCRIAWDNRNAGRWASRSLTVTWQQNIMLFTHPESIQIFNLRRCIWNGGTELHDMSYTC